MSRLHLWILLLWLSLSTVCGDESPFCNYKYNLANCKNNELRYQVEVDGPNGDIIVVDQKVRRMPPTTEPTVGGVFGSLFQRKGPFAEGLTGWRSRLQQLWNPRTRRTTADRLKRRSRSKKQRTREGREARRAKLAKDLA